MVSIYESKSLLHGFEGYGTLGHLLRSDTVAGTMNGTSVTHLRLEIPPPSLSPSELTALKELPAKTTEAAARRLLKLRILLEARLSLKTRLLLEVQYFPKAPPLSETTLLLARTHMQAEKSSVQLLNHHLHQLPVLAPA